MAGKFKSRMASEQGFTLIELLVVIVILGILVAIAVPSYLAFRGNAQGAAAKSNVRSAIPAAESFYQVGSTYTNIQNSTLKAQAPGISPNVLAAANAAGSGYCLADSEDGGVNYAWYTGGTGGAATIGYGTKATMDAAGACDKTVYVGSAAGDHDTIP